MQLESQRQYKLIKQYESKGFYPIKLIKTNKNGIADLLILRPDGTCFFHEVKAKNGRIAPLQLYRKKEIESLGFTYIIDNL